MLWGQYETFQGDPRLYLYSDRHGMNHKGDYKNWHLLLKVPSIDEVNMMWWDAGLLEILIDKPDLKNLLFLNTYAHIVSS